MYLLGPGPSSICWITPSILTFASRALLVPLLVALAFLTSLVVTSHFILLGGTFHLHVLVSRAFLPRKLWSSLPRSCLGHDLCLDTWLAPCFRTLVILLSVDCLKSIVPSYLNSMVVPSVLFLIRAIAPSKLSPCDQVAPSTLKSTGRA